MNVRIGIFGLLFGMTTLLSVISPPGLYGQEKTHTVRKGETLYSIARSFGIKADDLMKHNGITDPSRLQAGRLLKIPSPAQEEPPSGAARAAADYRVVRGDTLYSIARRFSVSVAALRELNGLSQSYVLREGDSLKLPQGAAQNPPSAVAEVPRTGSGGNVSAAPQNPPAPGVKWPVSARELSYMTGKLSGVVITGTRAESVVSLTHGTVLSAGPYRGFGRVVIIQVEGGYLYVYGGCESLSVKEGDQVAPGNELGKLGIDAVSNKPQLFFMVYRSNTPVDPAKAPRA